LRTLDDEGWEIGLHGSYRSQSDPDRLQYEKRALEDLLGARIIGGRQHYLHLQVPETWRHHARIGLRYDSSLGSSEEYGFQYGYRPIRPFGDEFVVFPLTVMEQALPDPGADSEAAWAACERLLQEAAENEAVMTALWHPRYFSESDFPGYRGLYERLLDRALEMGAWVGPPRDCYRKLDLDRDCTRGYEGKEDGNKGVVCV
jgi:peptidoglycan/xylan/chitin deacetylase (PgdA/CDA1 family)